MLLLCVQVQLILKIRKGLDVINHNVMSIEEGIIPIIDAIYGKYISGEVIFYRKGMIDKITKSDAL